MVATGRTPNDPTPATWRNREAVRWVLLELIDDFGTESDPWENTTVPAYLEGLWALLGSIENHYTNTDRDIPDDPWIVMADALKGARYYE